ncbi:MAG: hypothetical protein ACPKQO_01960 [Nitrososphaeraceae archaeon]
MIDTFNELVEMFGVCSSDKHSTIGSWENPDSDIEYKKKCNISYLQGLGQNKIILKENIKRSISFQFDIHIIRCIKLD